MRSSVLWHKEKPMLEPVKKFLKRFVIGERRVCRD